MHRAERIKNMETWVLIPDSIACVNQLAQEPAENIEFGSLRIMDANLKFYARRFDTEHVQIQVIALYQDKTGRNLTTELLSYPLEEKNIKAILSGIIARLSREWYPLRWEYDRYNRMCQEKMIVSTKAILLHRDLQNLRIYKLSDKDEAELKAIFSKMRTPKDYDDYFDSLPDADLSIINWASSGDQILKQYETLIPECKIFSCDKDHVNTCDSMTYNDWCIIQLYKENDSYHWNKIHPLTNKIGIWISIHEKDIMLNLDISDGKTYTSEEIVQMIGKCIINNCDYEAELSELYTLGVICNN